MKGSEGDISGVPAVLLGQVYQENVEDEYSNVARRIGINDSWLRRIVSIQTVPVVKLGLADRICLALGLNVSALVRQGELVIVPLHGTVNSAMKIVNEEQALIKELEGEPMTDQEVQWRVKQLIGDFNKYCSRSEEQIARREREAIQRGREPQELS